MTETKITLDPSFRASLSRYLTQDIIEGLPDRSAISKASRHLNTLRVALSSFLPRYIADAEDQLTKVYSDFRPGTFMFADVSGFTALSEKLQQATGVEGAEIMTQIINDFFSTMLEILAKSDGQMLKFAGDALLTFFPVSGEDTEDPAKTVAGKAIRTGLRMQRAMKEKFQPVQHPVLKEIFGDHNLELTMSIGISQGRLFEALVGNVSQRDHMIMGSLPAMASAAEEAGVRDDVIIDAHLAERFKAEFTLAPAPQNPAFTTVVDDLGDNLGDFELTTIVSRRRSTISGLVGFTDQIDPLEELRQMVSRVDNYARFVATEVVNKLAITGDRVESQNRPATVMFAYFRGIAQLLEAWGDAELARVTAILNRFYSGIQQVIASYGGSLTRSDPYKDGSKLLITFGAPIAHPDDPFRAVATALGMLQETKRFNEQLHQELPPPLRRETYLEMRMGIAHGQAFAGEVGWKQRREYTVMGDDVNLAARLMGMSSMGNIWISERIYKRVERFFQTVKYEPMKLKGKSKLIQVYNVTGWQAGITDIPRTSNTRFIGRDTLLLTMELALEQVKARRRRVIALVGYTGMGKTRIAKQILHEAQHKGFDDSWATCLTMDNARVTWGTVIRQLLEISHDHSITEQQERLVAALQKFGVADLEPVFRELIFGLERTAPENAELNTRRATQEIQQDPGPELDAAIVRLLEAIIKDLPVIIVLDDIHKAHPVAVRILQHVLDTIKNGRLMILLAYEPGHDFYAKPTLIEDLNYDQTLLMATDILYAPELGSRLARLLWEQTHGRPLFIEAMLQAWQEEDLIEIHRGVAEIKDDKRAQALPDHIRNLAISFIDRLPHDQQEILRAAAVIAAIDKEITAPMLAQVAGFQNMDAFEKVFKPLCDLQVMIPGQDDKFHLHYGLAQQALYESLTRLQRQNLHANAAEYLQSQPDAGENFFLIVEHLVKSGKLMRALEMVDAAAAEAEKQDDLESAIEFYEHALTLFPNDRSLQRAMARIVQKAARAVVKRSTNGQPETSTAPSPAVAQLPTEAKAEPASPPADAAPPVPKKKKVDPLSITSVVRTVMNDKSKTNPGVAPSTSKKRKWLSRHLPGDDK